MTFFSEIMFDRSIAVSMTEGRPERNGFVIIAGAEPGETLCGIMHEVAPVTPVVFLRGNTPHL